MKKRLTESQLRQIIESQIKKSINEEYSDRTRFRIEIYADITLDLNPEEDFDLEKERERAKEEMEEIIKETIGKEVGNVYIGKVYHYPIQSIGLPPELYKD